MNNDIVLGIFENKSSAEKVITQLQSQGYNPKDISIVMKETKETGNVRSEVVHDVTTGAVTGAVVGGIAGLVGSFIIPGLGAFLIGGPIADVLGLTGAAAATVSGAATGVVAGGIIGGLTDLGLTESEAKHYQQRIEAGGILVAVPARAGEEKQVEQMLTSAGADQVKIVEARLRNEKTKG